MRRAFTWLLVVPLALLGSDLAHGLDFWLAAPDREARARLLAQTGHAHEGLAPVAVGLCGLLIFLALLSRTLEARRGERSRRLPFAAFALLPPLAFALRELIERAAEQNALALHTFVEPVFVYGVALQLPFALLAFVVARALLSAAERIGAALVSGRDAPLSAAAVDFVFPARPDLGRLSPLAFAVSGRGPPSRR